MPNRNHVPRYRKHKASGQAVVYLDGKRHYLGKHGTAASKQAYNRLIGEWLAHGRRLPTHESLSVNEVALAYVRHAKNYYRESPLEVEKIRLALRPVKQLYGMTDSASFGPLALKAIRQSLIEAGLARRTINMRTDIVKRMFKWATASEMVPPSVHHGLQAVEGLRRGRSDARETEPVKPVPAAFVEAVKPLLSPQIRAMIDLQTLTAMRPGEVVNMRACEIEMTGNTWIYRPERHKTGWRGHNREIYIGPKAQEIIKPFLKADTQAFLFSPQEAREERYARMRAKRKTKVQPSQACRRKKRAKKLPGERYDVHAYRRAIHYACDSADVPRWSPNRLRHNAATNLRKQYGVELARIILGHATAFTTEIYAEADRQQAMEIIAKIG